MTIMSSIETATIDALSCRVVRRGQYNEILSISGSPTKEIIERFQACLPERFVEFDRKLRGDALNLDLYAYCEQEQIAVVQIRHAFRRAARHHMNTHKDYVLCGFNEHTRAPFRHPVSGLAVHAAIAKEPKDPAAGVRGAKRWMWGVTDKQLAKSSRQGDVLLVPEPREPKGTVITDTTYLVGHSHEVQSSRIILGAKGRIYAWAPTLWHVKAQHDPLYADHEGWYSVRLAREADAWDWGERLGD